MSKMETDIAVLQEQMKTLTANVDKMAKDYEDLVEEIRSIITAIKTGKWIICSIFFVMGAVGHKSWSYIYNWLSSN